MRSPGFYRLLVVHFRLWRSALRIRVGGKRRQLFHGDLPVYYLLWGVQVIYLRFPMFVPLPVHPIEVSLLIRTVTQRSRFMSFGNPPLTRDGYSAKPMLRVLLPSLDTLGSLRCNFTVGFHV